MLDLADCRSFAHNCSDDDDDGDGDDKLFVVKLMMISICPYLCFCRKN